MFSLRVMILIVFDPIIIIIIIIITIIIIIIIEGIEIIIHVSRS